MSDQEPAFQFLPDGEALPKELWTELRVQKALATALGLPEHAVQVHGMHSWRDRLSVELTIDAARVIP